MVYYIKVIKVDKLFIVAFVFMQREVRKMSSACSLEKSNIASVIKQLHKVPELETIRMGIAGSVARGTATSNSDIDIVVDTDCLSLPTTNRIKSAFNGRDVDVLCLGLLKEDDVQLDALLKGMGLPINDDSVYKTISREVIWVD